MTRNRLLAVPLALQLSFLAVACRNGNTIAGPNLTGSPVPTPVPPTSASLRGAVDSSTGAALIGAAVEVQQGSLVRGATTGADGRYEISGLQPGAANLSAHAFHYFEGSTAIFLRAGQNTRGVSLVYCPPCGTHP